MARQPLLNINTGVPVDIFDRYRFPESECSHFLIFAMPSRYFINQLADFAAGSAEKASSRLNNSHQAFKEKTLETAALCIKKFPATSANVDGGLYVGISGLAYALWYAASKKTIFSQTERGHLLKEARRLIDYNLRFDKEINGEEGGFLLGASGVYMTAALIYKEFDDNATVAKYVEKCKKLCVRAAENTNFLKHGSDEMFVGRAGYLCAILNLHLKVNENIFDGGLIKGLIKTILDSGSHYAKRHGSKSPLMYAYHGTEYLGAAHGLTGILQMCLSFSAVQLDAQQTMTLKGAVDWLCSVQANDGNFPSDTEELLGAPELVHWCHGAPGTIYLLARAYQIWHEDRYLQAALQCGEIVWRKGLLKKGPGICHGIAGNAYVFLVLYRMTGYADERHLHRALQFVDFIDRPEFESGARTPDTPYSLFEGLAGTLCVYADLSSGMECRDGWEYPLMPVFF